MSVFQERLMDGYTKYAENFDKWCKKAYPLLGEIRQCGIIELDRSGDALIATNRPDIGEQNLENKWYLYEPNWSFIENFADDISLHTSQFSCDLDIYENEYKCSWFCHRELIDNDTQQICFFSADSPIIYNHLTQSLSLVKKLIKFFKDENKHIIDYYRDRKFDLESENSNYKVKRKSQFTERDKVNYLLYMSGALKEGVVVSEREWQCIKMFKTGKTSAETGKILGLSPKTIANYWHLLEKKFNAHGKSQVLDIIF
jgi:DNA-binding CsgD family transcriptional regulator